MIAKIVVFIAKILARMIVGYVVVVAKIVAGAIVSSIMIVANRRYRCKGSRRKRIALVDMKLLLFISPVLGKKAKRLVLANGWIASHRLVVHRNTPIDAAVCDEIQHELRHVGTLVSKSIIRPYDLPSLILGSGTSRVGEC